MPPCFTGDSGRFGPQSHGICVFLVLVAGCVGWRMEWERESVPGMGTAVGTQH